MNSQSILVPKISTLPVHEPRSRAIVRWLVRKNIIKEELTTCGRTGNRMGYARARGSWTGKVEIFGTRMLWEFMGVLRCGH